MKKLLVIMLFVPFLIEAQEVSTNNLLDDVGRNLTKKN